jgi:hypothetical protein
MDSFIQRFANGNSIRDFITSRGLYSTHNVISNCVELYAGWKGRKIAISRLAFVCVFNTDRKEKQQQQIILVVKTILQMHVYFFVRLLLFTFYIVSYPGMVVFIEYSLYYGVVQ